MAARVAGVSIALGIAVLISGCGDSAGKPTIERVNVTADPLPPQSANVATSVPTQPEVVLSTEQAIDKIEMMGGTVAFDDADPAKPVVRVSLTDLHLTDEDLACLKGLTSIEALGLAGNKITDTGLSHLQGLLKIRILYLSATQITDAGLDQLKGFAELEDLNLRRTNITGKGLVALHSLKNLKSIDLSECPVSDDIIKNLAKLKGLETVAIAHFGLPVEGYNSLTGKQLSDLSKLPSLRYLDLSRNRGIRNEGLKHLKDLTALKGLSLAWVGIGDEGIQRLRGLTNLEKLDLQGNALSDAGLECLAEMTQLEALDVSNTKVTDVGVEHLKSRLPNLKLVVKK